MRNHKIGKLGENYAAQFLQTQNYKILHHNFHSQYGEIDLIATHEQKIIFIEVKTRSSDEFGEPHEALTANKKRKLLKTIFHFFDISQEKHPFSWRLDLIALKLTREGKLKDLIHFKNILDG